MYTSISLKSDSFPALIELSPGLKIDTHDTQQYSNPSTFVPLTADRFRIVGGTERPVESCNDDAGTSTLIGRPRYSTRAASSKDVVLGTILRPGIQVDLLKIVVHTIRSVLYIAGGMSRSRDWSSPVTSGIAPYPLR